MNKKYKILFDNYKDIIYKIAYYITQSEEDSKDVVKQSFTKAFLKSSASNDKSKFEIYIYKFTFEYIKTKLKKSNKALDNFDNVIPILFEKEFHIPLSISQTEEFCNFIKEELKNLKNKYKVILILYYYLDLSMSDISKILNISPNLVKCKIHKGKSHFKQVLEDSDFLKEETLQDAR